MDVRHTLVQMNGIRPSLCQGSESPLRIKLQTVSCELKIPTSL